MEIKELAAMVTSVCGLDTNWAKTCIYYCMATHKLNDIAWMPILSICAPPGTDKTETIKVLNRISYSPVTIACHETMTSPLLRQEFAEAKDRTLIIEEADLYPNRRELERYLINRVDKSGASIISINVADAFGNYRKQKIEVFGATIIHGRHDFTDLATQRRSITVNIRHDPKGTFVKPHETLLQRLSLPTFGFADVPDMFNGTDTSGAALDTWAPLIRVANNVNDKEWLNWAWLQVSDMKVALSEDGGTWELDACIFKNLLKECCDSSNKIDSSILKDPISLPDITHGVQAEYKWIAPKTISTILRKWGLTTRQIGGITKVFVTPEELRGIASDIGYEDESLV